MSDNTVIPESHKDLLESTALADVATIGPDGAPRSTRSGLAGTAPC